MIPSGSSASILAGWGYFPDDFTVDQEEQHFAVEEAVLRAEALTFWGPSGVPTEPVSRSDEARLREWNSRLYDEPKRELRRLREAYSAFMGSPPSDRYMFDHETRSLERRAAAAGIVTSTARAEAEKVRGENVTVALARFPLLDIVGLLDPDRPPRRWLWDGMVPEGDHVSIVAAGGTGKSLLVLGLAISAMRGETEFVGRALSAPQRVLYVDMENSEDDWAERLDDFGVTSAEAKSWAGRFLPLSFPSLGGLDTKDGAAQLMSVIDAYQIGAGDLLVLDSMQRVTEGEENSNDTTRKLYNFTSVELKRRGITVIRTDNTGHEGDRARGGSAKRDDVAFAWVLSKVDGTDDNFTLKPSKRRAAGSSDKLSFARITSPTGRLQFIASSGTAFSTTMARVERALADAKVPPSAGQAAAWAAVQALAGGVPDGVTRALVRRAQHARREAVKGFGL